MDVLRCCIAPDRKPMFYDNKFAIIDITEINVEKYQSLEINDILICVCIKYEGIINDELLQLFTENYKNSMDNIIKYSNKFIHIRMSIKNNGMFNDDIFECQTKFLKALTNRKIIIYDNYSDSHLILPYFYECNKNIVVVTRKHTNQQYSWYMIKRNEQINTKQVYYRDRYVLCDDNIPFINALQIQAFHSDNINNFNQMLKLRQDIILCSCNPEMHQGFLLRSINHWRSDMNPRYMQYYPEYRKMSEILLLLLTIRCYTDHVLNMVPIEVMMLFIPYLVI